MYNAIHFYRLSHWLYMHKVPLLPKLLTLLIFLIYNSKIPPSAVIGKRTEFGYGGMGVVVHSDCVVGDDCVICQQVTLGGGNNRYPGVPTIGNNVYIAKGAAVIGGITVGDNVTIGVNCVVTKPVPDNAVVAGVPGRVLRIKQPEECSRK